MSGPLHSIERIRGGWALVREQAGERKKTLRTFKTEQAAVAALNVAAFGGAA